MPLTPPRRALLAAPLLLLLPALAACVRTASPEGWAPPISSDADHLLLSLDNGQLSSLQLGADTPARVTWTFPNKALDDQKDLKPQGIYAPPILDSGTVFVATLAEGLFALDTQTGAEIWRRPDLGENIVDAFALAPGDRLAVGTSDGWLHLLDPTTGKAAEGWPAAGLRLNGGIWATLVSNSTALFVATMKGEVFSLDPATTQPIWPQPFQAHGAILDLSLLPNGQLFVPSLDGHVYLVDAASGEQLASVPTTDWVWMQPAVEGDLAFFGDLGGHLYALDITTGELHWQVPPDPGDGLPPIQRVKARPAVINGRLIVADRSPAVHFFDPDTGQRLNRVPIDAKTVRAPVVDRGGMGLVLATNGRLFRADPTELSVVQIPIGSNP